jgi:hypothetical protein
MHAQNLLNKRIQESTSKSNNELRLPQMNIKRFSNPNINSSSPLSSNAYTPSQKSSEINNN